MAETVPERLVPNVSEGRTLPRQILPRVGAIRGEYWRHVPGILGWFLVALVVGTAVFADLLAPISPWTSVATPFQPPGPAHRLGTDDLGRDLLTSVIHATRTSLLVGLTAAALSTSIGVLLGAVSGYFGGLLDDLIMRFTEFFQVIPRFFLALVAIALFRPGLVTITLVLGLTAWPMTCRLLRAQIFSVREREFVIAAHALGAGPAFILRRHILPNAISPVVIHTSLLIGQMMLIEASLAFLGLGDPNHISLGYMLRNAQPFLRLAWWMSLFPGVVIALAVLGFNLVGDSINDARLRGNRTNGY
jgi:peptide/nickel transport system permease protein